MVGLLKDIAVIEAYFVGDVRKSLDDVREVNLENYKWKTDELPIGSNTGDMREI